MPQQNDTSKLPQAIAKFRMSYDTTTPENPTTAYLRMKTKILLPSEMGSYSALIQSLKSHIESDIEDEIRKRAHWHQNFIAVAEISDKGLRYRASCFLKYEITLRTAQPMDWPTVQSNMVNLANSINEKILGRLTRCHIALK